MAYYMLLTTAGQAKLAASISTGTPLPLTDMAIGDGNGSLVTPVEGMTALVHEVWRGPLNTLTVHPEHASWVVATAQVPGTAGGWTAREVGIYDDDGALFAVGNCPETYKPLTSEGTAKELLMKATLAVTNASAVTISIDPSSVLATMQYVDDNFVHIIGDTMTGPLILSGDPEAELQAAPKRYVEAEITAHEAKPDPHPQYATDTDLANHAAAVYPHPNQPRAVGSDLVLYAQYGGL